ncbi:hypothetical protein K7419_002904 [Morganella morganii]|nr:hypothetical protein [Morganella morganii]
MTVSTELSHEEYTGNGVTTDFDFRFRIFEAKHLVVSVADPDGAERILTNGTDYTLRGVGSYRGGKVILKMPLATGWKIGIARDLPAVQETDLRNQGKFFAEVHEDAFDYLTMLIQKSLGYLSLCLRKPSFISDHYDAKGNKISNLGKPVKDGDAVDLATMNEHISAKDKRSLRVADKDIPALPNVANRANKLLSFDRNGNPVAITPESGSATDVLSILADSDGWALIGAGETNVSGLSYVFTKAKDGIIKKSDLRSWVNEGINSGKTYFSVPPGEYILESDDDSPFVEIANIGSEKMFILDLNGAILKYNGDIVVEAFIKVIGRSAYITIQNGRIFCNQKINYGVLTDDIIGISQFKNIEFRRPLLDGYNISAWLHSYDNCVVFYPGRHGWYVGATAATSTSTSALFKTSWVKSPGGHGFYLGRLTYANFINSAYDGESAGTDNDNAVIGLWGFVYGLTINGMGTENFGGRLIKQDVGNFGLRGLTINGWHLFKVGVSTAPMDYLFDLNNITRITIFGITKNDAFSKKTGLIRNDTVGDAIIVSPDGTASGWDYADGGIPSYGFGCIEWSRMPIKRASTATVVTKSVSTLDELVAYLEYLKTVVIDIGVEINLQSSILIPASGKQLVISGLRGGGTVKIITTSSSTVEFGSREIFKPFSIKNNDCPVIIKGLTLVGWNQYGTLFNVVSSRVGVSACKFSAYAQGGIMFEGYNCSDITISGDCTKVGTWAPIDGYEFVIDTTSKITKRTETNIKWDSL